MEAPTFGDVILNRFTVTRIICGYKDMYVPYCSFTCKNNFGNILLRLKFFVSDFQIHKCVNVGMNEQMKVQKVSSIALAVCTSFPSLFY